jgi:hypothetical protein
MAPIWLETVIGSALLRSIVIVVEVAYLARPPCSLLRWLHVGVGVGG